MTTCPNSSPSRVDTGIRSLNMTIPHLKTLRQINKINFKNAVLPNIAQEVGVKSLFLVNPSGNSYTSSR